MGSLLPWKTWLPKHTLLTRSGTFQLLCAQHSHTKCLGECKTIHKHNEHRFSRKRHKPCFSFYRWGQRQTLCCTSISLQPTQTNLQVGEHRNPASLLQKCGAGEVKGKGEHIPWVTQNRHVPNNQMLTQNILYQHIPWTNPEDNVVDKKGKIESSPKPIFRFWEGGQRREKETELAAV